MLTSRQIGILPSTLFHFTLRILSLENSSKPFFWGLSLGDCS
uniref:Uncharacterized protein n=1 Tax=Rhizophora mucronata TaxID=61149 RepID=A0A2P2PQJ3_RHIMU